MRQCDRCWLAVERLLSSGLRTNSLSWGGRWLRDKCNALIFFTPHHANRYQRRPFMTQPKFPHMAACLDQQSCFRTFSACLPRHPEIKHMQAIGPFIWRTLSATREQKIMGSGHLGYNPAPVIVILRSRIKSRWSAKSHLVFR